MHGDPFLFSALTSAMISWVVCNSKGTSRDCLVMIKVSPVVTSHPFMLSCHRLLPKNTSNIFPELFLQKYLYCHLPLCFQIKFIYLTNRFIRHRPKCSSQSPGHNSIKYLKCIYFPMPYNPPPSISSNNV